MKINVSRGHISQSEPIIWKDGTIYLSRENADSGVFFLPEFNAVLPAVNKTKRKYSNPEFVFDDDIVVESWNVCPRCLFCVPPRDTSKWDGMTAKEQEEFKKRHIASRENYNRALKRKRGW